MYWQLISVHCYSLFRITLTTQNSASICVLILQCAFTVFCLMYSKFIPHLQAQLSECSELKHFKPGWLHVQCFITSNYVHYLRFSAFTPHFQAQLTECSVKIVKRRRQPCFQGILTGCICRAISQHIRCIICILLQLPTAYLIQTTNISVVVH